VINERTSVPRSEGQKIATTNYILRRNQVSDEPKKDEQAPEVKPESSGESLPEKELDKVAAGGKIKWVYTQQKRAD
jgi:hypothetical protein